MFNQLGGVAVDVDPVDRICENCPMAQCLLGPVVRAELAQASLQPDDLSWSLDVAAGQRQLADSGTVASPPSRALDLTQTRAGGKAIEVRRALQLRRAAPG